MATLKKKTETYDWSLFQDLSIGVLHHLYNNKSELCMWKSKN